MNTPIGDKLFQHIPRLVVKFRENRPRDVENLVDGKKYKKINNTTKIEQSLAIAIAIAGDCNNLYSLSYMLHSSTG